MVAIAFRGSSPPEAVRTELLATTLAFLYFTIRFYSIFSAVLATRPLARVNVLFHWIRLEYKHLVIFTIFGQFPIIVALVRFFYGAELLGNNLALPASSLQYHFIRLCGTYEVVNYF